MEENRRHQRYGRQQSRRFIAKRNNSEETIGEIKDFSRSGLSFDSKQELSKEVRLDLELEGLKQRVPASVEIIWSKKSADSNIYGARFTNISPESKFEILNLLYQDWRDRIIPQR